MAVQCLVAATIKDYATASCALFYVNMSKFSTQAVAYIYRTIRSLDIRKDSYGSSEIKP